MASVWRYRVEWSGSAVVGPGVSTFHWGVQPDVEDLGDLHTFFNSIKGFLPSNTTLTFQAVVEVLDVDTGTLQSTLVIPHSLAPIQGGGVGGFAAGVGVRVVWYTGGVFHGRKVRGSTFIVPITSAFYDDRGQISPANVGTLQTAAGTLVSNSALAIYSRPRKGQVGGSVSNVIAASAPQSVSWLRSRRT